MKTAVTIAGADAEESAFVVWRGFEESIQKAARYGYDGVELALKESSEIRAGDMRRWLAENRIEVSCITTGQVFANSHLYFTHPDRAVRMNAVKVFSDLIDLGEEFSGIVNVGRARGFIAEGQTREEAEKLFVDVMQILGEKAEKRRVQLIVEPVNRYEINFINSLDEGSAILRKVQRKNCGLHADVFHMNIEEDGIGKSLIRNGDLVRYVHLADSNRLAPGLGHLDFDEIMAALKKIHYDGWVSMEMLPGDNPDKMAGDAIHFIRPRVEKYNREEA